MAADISAPAKRGFGGFTKHFWTSTIPRQPYNNLTWVNRWYTPENLHSVSKTPVQTHKFVTNARPTSTVHNCWVPRPEAPPKRHSVCLINGEEVVMTSPAPATRDLQWSTLRQMLPSRGHEVRKKAERWGTSGDLALPTLTQKRPNYYPRVKSPMTRY